MNEQDFKQTLTGTIYRIVFPNGKVYIGQTIQNVKDRFGSHKKDAYHDANPAYYTLIGKAIRKYGKENIKLEILHEKIQWDDLDNLEISEIKNHSSMDPAKGYNMTEGRTL
jgi:group I intron endonuclease